MVGPNRKVINYGRSKPESDKLWVRFELVMVGLFLNVTNPRFVLGLLWEDGI